MKARLNREIKRFCNDFRPIRVALGVRAVVRKRREVWKKDNATFNLDRVDGVGKVFEVEVEVTDGTGEGGQIDHYRELFGAYLGAEIAGSNEDLVAGRSEGGPAFTSDIQPPGG